MSEISTGGALAGVAALANWASSEELTGVVVWATDVVTGVRATAWVAIVPVAGADAVAPARPWGPGAAPGFQDCFEQAESATHTTVKASVVEHLRMRLV